MIALPYLTLYRVSGADASDFLQAQLAADIAALQAGQAGFAAWCSPRGQVIALLLVCRLAGDWLVACDIRLAHTLFKRLPMYVLRSRVSFEHLAEQGLACLPEGAAAGPGAVVFQPLHTSLRYALVTQPPAGLADTDPPGTESWRAAELLHGVVWLQAATSEQFLPQMLGLERIGAVSFSKGCYPGQEIVARTRYLGKLKRKPVLLETTGQPVLAAGEPCQLHSGGQACAAVVIDSAPGKNGCTVVLAVAPLEESAAVESLETSAARWPSRRLAVAPEH